MRLQRKIGLFGAPMLAISAITAHAATIVTGGDVGEGLTLDAPNVVGALAVGTGGVNPVVQGVRFYTDGANAAGDTHTLTYVGQTSGGGNNYTTNFAFDLAQTSTDDDALKAVANRLFFAPGTGGSGLGGYMRINIGGLTPNTNYKFDVLTTLGQAFTGPAGNSNSAYSRDIRIFAEQSTGPSTVEDSITVQGKVPASANLSPLYLTTFQYSSGADGVVHIGAVPGTTAGNVDGAFFSGIIVTAVPEPTSAAVVGLAGAFLMRRRRESL